MTKQALAVHRLIRRRLQLRLMGSSRARSTGDLTDAEQGVGDRDAAVPGSDHSLWEACGHVGEGEGNELPGGLEVNTGTTAEISAAEQQRPPGRRYADRSSSQGWCLPQIVEMRLTSSWHPHGRGRIAPGVCDQHNCVLVELHEAFCSACHCAVASVSVPRALIPLSLSERSSESETCPGAVGIFGFGSTRLTVIRHVDVAAGASGGTGGPPKH